MNRILIDGVEFPCPLSLNMSKSANIVSEITTLSGSTIADVNGWRYDDITLKWDWIKNSKLQELLEATSTDTFNFTFKDVDTGTEKTIKAYRTNVSCIETANVDESGEIVWRGIEIQLAFPDCYH